MWPLISVWLYGTGCFVTMMAFEAEFGRRWQQNWRCWIAVVFWPLLFGFVAIGCAAAMLWKAIFE
jgi:hypothetical protein